jgi:hypothetical protein
MPGIIAICPYCRAGGVRAPATAIGASATCPKCRSSFTVLPSDDIPPDWDKPAPRPVPAFLPPAAPALDETRPTATMADVTEPSPVLTADGAKTDRAKSEPRSAGESGPAAESAPGADAGTLLALVALCLVGPAMLATLFPYGRGVGAGLAAVGIAVGGLGAVGGGRGRTAAAVAVAVQFAVLVVLVLFPSWLGLDPWGGPDRPAAPQGPVAVANADGATRPVPANGWLDAAADSWQHGDARVSARSDVGPVELSGPKEAKRTTKESYLRVTLRVRNVGFEKDLPLSGWAAGEGAGDVRVTDASGVPLAPAAFDAGWAPPRGRPVPRARPGHASEVVLLFAAPPAKTDSVRVRLPGAAVGVPDEITFRTGTAAAPPRPPGQ